MEKDSGGQDGEALEAEEGLRRQDEGPDFVQVGVGEAEAVQHGLDVFGPDLRRWDCLRLGTRVSGGDAGNACQKAALASTSAKREPATEARTVLRSCPAGWGMVREPASTWAMANPATAASATGQRKASGLVGSGEALRGGGETLTHAGGEGEI